MPKAQANTGDDLPASIPAMAAGSPTRDNPLTRSGAGIAGLTTLALLIVLCLGTLPWTMTSWGAEPGRAPRFDDQILAANRLPPGWLADLPDNWADPAVWGTPDAAARDRVTAGYHAAASAYATGALIEQGVPPADAAEPTPQQIREHKPLYPFGTDNLGRSLFVRTLAGGAVSIGVGLAAAAISVLIGTLYGALAGYLGGKADALMMRVVDVLYGLPYILLVVLLAVAGDALVTRYDNHLKQSSAESRWTWMLAQAAQNAEPAAEPPTAALLEPGADETAAESEGPERFARANNAIAAYATDPSPPTAAAAVNAVAAADRDLDALAPLLAWAAGSQANAGQIRADATDQGYEVKGLSGDTVDALQVIVLLTAIGGVSWLTMARVIRGQVLSLKSRPFMEAARAMGVPARAQFARHLLPNLVGPIVVYATLTVPQAVLQESFLSFLGIGIQPPLPSWGNLAAAGLSELNTVQSRWWLLFFPCALLGLTLLALNFVGEGLREAFDPKRARK